MLMLEGQNYYVRTNTDHWIGRCVACNAMFVTLADAAWIADSGRLSVFMAQGEAPNMEIEPVGEITCRWEAFLPWPHKLFKNAV